MGKLIGLSVFCGFIWFLWIFFEGRLKTRKEKTEHLPYTKKQYFLTNNERSLLAVIEKIVDNRYYIFPQVHFSKIIYAQGQQNFKNPYFNKIDRKSADFVLFDKQNVSPVLVIEVDDASHNRPDRIERDGFIDRVLERCGIPIVRVQPLVSEGELREMLEKGLKV